MWPLILKSIQVTVAYTSRSSDLPFILKTICMNVILWDNESVWPSLWHFNKGKPAWPLFHVPVIWPFILKTIWWISIMLFNDKLMWWGIWPENKCRSQWPVFHGPMIKDYLMDELWDDSVWHDLWHHNKCRSAWFIFHGPVILTDFLTGLWMHVILWDNESVWMDLWF